MWLYRWKMVWNYDFIRYAITFEAITSQTTSFKPFGHFSFGSSSSCVCWLFLQWVCVNMFNSHIFETSKQKSKRVSDKWQYFVVVYSKRDISGNDHTERCNYFLWGISTTKKCHLKKRDDRRMAISSLRIWIVFLIELLDDRIIFTCWYHGCNTINFTLNTHTHTQRAIRYFPFVITIMLQPNPVCTFRWTRKELTLVLALVWLYAWCTTTTTTKTTTIKIVIQQEMNEERNICCCLRRNVTVVLVFYRKFFLLVFFLYCRRYLPIYVTLFSSRCTVCAYGECFEIPT